jgi:hypothetical protein
MDKRHRLLFGIFFVGAIAVLFLWVLWPKDRLNEKGFDLIQKGMTQKEVEAILGVPPGDYSNGAVAMTPEVGSGLMFGPGIMVSIHEYLRDTTPREDGCCANFWIGNEQAIQVTFDSDGKTVYTQFFAVYIPRTYLEKLRRMFGL